MIATDLKTGTVFKENNSPWKVEKYAHIKAARSGASVKVKARNLLTDEVREMSFLGGVHIEEANVERSNAQFLYHADGYFFMDPKTYDQFEIPEKVLGDQAKYLKDSEIVQVMYYEGDPVSIDLPNSIVYEVTYTEPGYKGNTVSNVYKDAELDSKFTAKVPAFVNIGDKVKIDTRTGEYISKA
jgi:elongation factor P